MLTLVLGGIRSGKSAWAADLARGLGGRVAVLATGVASDQEMRDRIEAHRRARPADWRVYETRSQIDRAIPDGSADVALLDSIDGWIDLAAGPGHHLAQVQALCQRVPNVIVVSSEVGLSLVPLSATGRAYTDALGSVNQGLAALAARVYLVVAGLPLVLKDATP
ncbi:MAG TPA: bifunctional adenosylcobinamide kinase/adenosylcobinamide-phosphate guanylyltransferase [Candidatus Nitrosotalea sp.]|nr:bifunctional adenosylcobinamide kinase/adenosylcobinamide-phosphate guanylyltransferase [Candidatus Nitrosotalea sp.]